MGWAFFKADRQAVYKNLPLSPDQSDRCVVALRCPSDGRWYGFLSRTLLFGAAAAVLRYNCFSLQVFVLADRISGLPIVNYFDDFGCLITDFPYRPAVRVFTSFCRTVGIKLKRKKTEVGRRIAFLGLEGWYVTVGRPGGHEGEKADREDFGIPRCGCDSAQRIRIAHRPFVVFPNFHLRKIRPRPQAAALPQGQIGLLPMIANTNGR